MTAWIDPLDVAFMAAAEWSERHLAELGNGWTPPCTSADLERVRHDAFRAIATGLPEPARYAADLTPEIAGALMEAVHGRNGGLWASDGPLVPVLRAMGLVAINDRQLTDFAMEVRRALRIAAGEAVPPRKVKCAPTPTRARSASEMGSSGKANRGEYDKPRCPTMFVESSLPCNRCGCRPDACTCRKARR